MLVRDVLQRVLEDRMSLLAVFASLQVYLAIYQAECIHSLTFHSPNFDIAFRYIKNS
jgi:hypothetical protein